jgi:hypothetical protein
MVLPWLAFVVAEAGMVGDCLGDRVPKSNCSLSLEVVETLGGGVTDGELTTLEERLCLDGIGLTLLAAVDSFLACSDESKRPGITVGDG